MKPRYKKYSVDMWYGHKRTDADRIDINFYDQDCEYRGNIYKDGKAIGDYATQDSTLIQKLFPQLDIKWD